MDVIVKKIRDEKRLAGFWYKNNFVFFHIYNLPSGAHSSEYGLSEPEVELSNLLGVF